MQRFRYIILASMGIMLLGALAWGLQAGQITRNKQRLKQEEAYLQKFAKEDSLKQAFIDALNQVGKMNAEEGDALEEIDILMSENENLQAFWQKQKALWEQKSQDVDELIQELSQKLPEESEKYEELLDRLKQIKLVGLNHANADAQNAKDSAL